METQSKKISWSLQTRLVSELKAHPKNPRIITEKGLKELGDSFDEIGFAQPVNINQDNTILSGHARVMKLEELGVKEVNCYVPDRILTPKQEEAVIVRMNKNVAGQWDFNILANEFNIEDLTEWGFKDYELVGFDDVNKVNSGDENSEWVGMPEFEPKEDTLKIIIHFDSDIERDDFAKEKELQFSKKAGRTWSTSYPFRGQEDLSSLKYE